MGSTTLRKILFYNQVKFNKTNKENITRLLNDVKCCGALDIDNLVKIHIIQQSCIFLVRIIITLLTLKEHKCDMYQL